MTLPRDEILARLRAQIAAGRAILGTSAGIGLSASSAEAGGADLIVVYNSGRFRMAGRGSAAGLMPYGDANQIVMEMAGEILPVVHDTPVIAGVCGTDPFRHMPDFLDEIARRGFSGVQNFPTVGLIEGLTRATFEETGMGYELEVEMIRLARERGLLTMPYVFDADQAAAMTAAGADIVVPHMGTTTNGRLGAVTAPSMEESIERIAAMRDAARGVHSRVMVLCHGGPIATAADAATVLAAVPGVHGFLGASSLERLPVETAIAETVGEFKSIPLAKEANGHVRR